MTTVDYYELLEITRDADATEIKRAYRVQARRYHPDNNPGDAEAEARFKEVVRAYETLSDPDRRRHYDQFGADGPQMGDPFGGMGGFGSLFDTLFGGGGGFSGGPRGPIPGEDLEATAHLAFEEAVFGATHDVTVRTAAACEVCEATGAAPGTSAQRCDTCDGAGQVRQVRQSILGQMVTASPCPTCGGSGERIATPCDRCQGQGRTIAEKTYTVDIPAGVDEGSTLRLTGFGAVGPRGGPAGDLYVHVAVRPHHRFERDGSDLVEELHLPVTQAALGTTFAYETLDGGEELTIPRGTQTGKVFRIRGRGVPRVRGRGRGDIRVQVVVDTPTDLDEDAEAALRAWAERRGDAVDPPSHGLFSKVRKAFS